MQNKSSLLKMDTEVHSLHTMWGEDKLPNSAITTFTGKLSSGGD